MVVLKLLGACAAHLQRFYRQQIRHHEEQHARERIEYLLDLGDYLIDDIGLDPQELRRSLRGSAHDR
jgi:hypothetical protein